MTAPLPRTPRLTHCPNCGPVPLPHDCQYPSQAIPATPESDTLDAAWAAAEAALPKHWRLGIDPYYPSGWESYAYDIRRTPTSGLTKHSSGACYGDTPAAALRALAARLSEIPA